MLTKQEFNDAEILRNTPFTKGAIKNNNKKYK